MTTITRRNGEAFHHGLQCSIRSTTGLSELITRIEAEHAAVGQALQSALAHAIACGELLIEAKRQVKHGEWRPWIEANCKVPARTARHYMALARKRKHLCDQNGNVLPISVHDAVETIKELRGHPYTLPYDPVEMEEFPSRGIAYVRLTEAEIQERREARRREWWHVRAWGGFGGALMGVIEFGRWSNPPAPRHVAKAAKAGKTPGLTAESLRAASALLTRYAEALERLEALTPAEPPVRPGNPKWHRPRARVHTSSGTSGTSGTSQTDVGDVDDVDDKVSSHAREACGLSSREAELAAGPPWK
jgi:Protein of unknown function (DUF3102)